MSNAGQQKKSKPLTPKPTQVLKPVAKPPTGTSSTKLSGAMQVKPQQSAQKKQAAPSKAASPKVTPHSTKPLTQKTLENAPTDVLKGFTGELKNLGNYVGLGGVSGLKESWGGQVEDKKQRLNVSAAGQNLLQAQEVARLVKGQLDRSPTNPQLQAAYAKVKAQQKAAQAALNQAKLAPKQQTQAIINTVQSGHTGLLVGAAIADGLVGKTVGSVAKDGVFAGPKGKGTPPTPKNNPATVELALPGGGKIKIPANTEEAKTGANSKMTGKGSDGKLATPLDQEIREILDPLLFKKKGDSASKAKGYQNVEKQLAHMAEANRDLVIEALKSGRFTHSEGYDQLVSMLKSGDLGISNSVIMTIRKANALIASGEKTAFEIKGSGFDVDLATVKGQNYPTGYQLKSVESINAAGNQIAKAAQQLYKAPVENKVVLIESSKGTLEELKMLANNDRFKLDLIRLRESGVSLEIRLTGGEYLRFDSKSGMSFYEK